MTERDRLPGSTLLVVDDETALADLYCSQLESGYDVRVAYGGQEAIDEIDHTIDVVLLDRRMPDVTGDDVLERIRADGYDCRVIMVTAVDPDLDIVELPFEEYLVKPVSGDELREAVNRQLIYATYDDRIREYTRVRSKIDALRRSDSSGTIEEHEQFERLRMLSESIKDDVETLFEEHGQLPPREGFER